MDVDWDAFINRAFHILPKGVDYIQTKQTLIELYETEYGVKDHRRDPSPFSVIAHNPSEKFLDNYLFDNYFKTFMVKGVYQKTGLDFDTFMDKPRYEIEKILKLVSEFNAKKSEVAAGVTKDLEETLGDELS